MKNYIISTKKYFILFCVAILSVLMVQVQSSYAQLEEPEVRSEVDPMTPFDEDMRNRWGVDVMVNNFGFGVAGEYGRVIGPYTELFFATGITGLREASEQNFQDFYTGQQITPNKYNRALAFPFKIGLKKRLFAEEISDNMRLFISASGGPAMAFVFPYLNDRDGNGYRSTEVVNEQFLVPTEGYNDFFSGWGEGSLEWGGTGEVKLGVDIGRNFDSQTTVEFGYFFYYFDQGIQILQPNRPIYNSDGSVNRVEPFHDASKFFGTPQISIIFGGMW